MGWIREFRRSLWEKMVTELQRSALEEIVCVFRKIWLRRNKCIFEGKFDSPRLLFMSARTEKEEINRHKLY